MGLCVQLQRVLGWGNPKVNKTQAWIFFLKERRKKEKSQEAEDVLSLYSSGDNQNYVCRKWKDELLKETKCGYMHSHLCLSSDSRILFGNRYFSYSFASVKL